MSIERIRLLFRVKWRLYIFSRTTQHLLVVSNSFEAMMILIALSESLNLLKCWSLNSFSRSLPPLGSTKQKTFSKGCAQLHCFSCRWAKTPTKSNTCLRSIPPPLVFLKTSWILNCWIHLKISRTDCVNWLTLDFDSVLIA